MSIQTTITLVDEALLNVQADDSVSKYALQQYVANLEPNQAHVRILNAAYVLKPLQEATQGPEAPTQYVGPTPPPNPALSYPPGARNGMPGLGTRWTVGDGRVVDLNSQKDVIACLEDMKRDIQSLRKDREAKGDDIESLRRKLKLKQAECDELREEERETRHRTTERTQDLLDKLKESKDHAERLNVWRSGLERKLGVIQRAERTCTDAALRTVVREQTIGVKLNDE